MDFPRYENGNSNCRQAGISTVADQEEIRKILRHLVKIGRSPPGFDPVSLN